MVERDPYELFYWPGIQGRGEFVRLAFECVGAPYEDVARRPESAGGGSKAIIEILQDESGASVFAPPILRHGARLVSHTANILAYVGPRLGLVGESEVARDTAHQLQLTVTDFVAEIHNTHHPVSPSLYFEDQVEEAKRATHHFLESRMPKYLRHFEKTATRSGGPWILGDAMTYVDLSMFQLHEGLSYAFPQSFVTFRARIPHLVSIVEAVRRLEQVQKYLSSERRLSFNQHGLFRRYPELEG
ncbi:MAG: glutathione S-transferase family protein [Deltaproteobacteria bacterium]|nr:glutathione S-transferase family protein [Deltaproteobacteria bacterium]